MQEAIGVVAARGDFADATPERVWQHQLEMMAPGKPFRQRQSLRNGRDYVLHCHPMADGGWVTLCEETTERHRMERELHLQYERFDRAVNHMSHGLTMFGPDERLIVCNEQYIKMYGLDPAVARPGISSRDLLALWVHSLDEPGLTADELYERRKRASATDTLSTMRLHLKDGRVIEATTRRTPDGGWVTAHEDVTDRVGYEKVLREQNVLFDAALENMTHGLCVFDKDWRVVVRNRRYLGALRPRPERGAPRHVAGRPDAPEHRSRHAHREAERGEILRRFHQACRDRPRAGGASAADQRQAAGGAPRAAGKRRLGRHLRGHHGARARRRRARRSSTGCSMLRSTTWRMA